ncbi:MAG TPA: SusC/RagA family TonB-linked outer membrane protein [Longimicrobiales bacterium]
MSIPRVHPAACAVLTVLAVLGTAAAPLSAQGTGRISGQVVEATTQRPLAGAQVFIAGTQIGSLTDASGRYLLLGVPAGEVVVRVQLIGYSSVDRTVTVPSGGAATANFELGLSAISLDEIVVTGAGVETEKRKLGNTIATIDAPSLEVAPVNSVSQILQAREPGVLGLPGGGLSGQGARIRIRGSASLAQSNEPIVYVDGVRIDNSGGFAGSRLDDIDPNAIARIEILKGAAAATLYGTEASNGVIQIFTKRGSAGDPRWAVSIDQALTSYPAGQIAPNSGFARTPEQAESLSRFYGRDIQPFEPFSVPIFERIFETGYEQSYSMSLSGGVPMLSYYLSGRYATGDGPMGGEDLGPVRDTNNRKQFTLNTTIQPTDRLQLHTSGMYVHAITNVPNAGNSIYSPFSIALYSKPERATCFSEVVGDGTCAGAGNPTGAPTFGTLREVMYRQETNDAERFVGSIRATYELTPTLQAEATLGVDVLDDRGETVTPFGYNVDGISTSDTLGARSISARRSKELTVDVKANWDTRFGEDFTSTLVVGGQGFFSSSETAGGSGAIFPAPGIDVAGGAQNRDVFESALSVVNAGLLAQEQLGYRDWMFVTLGARYDKNSAFGETSPGAFYPKASVSLVPSDRSGWSSEVLSTLRIRAALGQSGLQPGAFDKITTFSAFATSLGPGLMPENLGNPDLKPEVSTEWELGAEAGMFDNRLGVSATYWNRKVEDALVPRQFAPSGGFTETQLDNIGSLSAHGLELGINGQAYAGRNLTVSLFANAAYMKERVESLGGAPPLKAQGSYPRVRNFIKEGYAPGAMFGAKLVGPCSARPAGEDYACLDAGRLPFDVNGDGAPDTEAELLAFLATPPDGSFDNPLLNPLLVDEDGDGDFLDHYLGKPTPDWSGAFGADIGFLQNFRLGLLFEYRLGFEITSITDGFRQASSSIGRNTPRAAWAEATLMNPASTAEERLEAVRAWAYELKALSPYSGLNMIKPGDFLRWREVSLTYDVPGNIAGMIGAETLALTVNGRNLALFTKYPGTDPELSYLPRCTEGGVSCNFADGVDAYGWPIPRRFGLSVRATF